MDTVDYINKKILKSSKSSMFYEYAPECYSMVYVPEKSIEPNVGLFLFNAGQKYRTGPHDIYVEIGLELASRGIFVITPDPGELGDGFKGFKFNDTQAHQFSIQRKRYVNDAMSSITFFKKELNLSKIFVSGLCGGTTTAISCAVKRNDIRGLLAWAPPFQLSNRVAIAANEAGKNVVRNDQKDRIAKKNNDGINIFRNIRTKYQKLVTLNVDWEYQFNRFENKIMKLIGRNASFDYRLAYELQTLYKRRHKMIFIYSENDLHYENFCRFYLPWFGEKNNVRDITFVLCETNHVVSDRKSLSNLCQIMYRFIINN